MHPDDRVLLDCVLEAIASEAIPLDDEQDIAALIAALAELRQKLSKVVKRRAPLQARDIPGFSTCRFP